MESADIQFTGTQINYYFVCLRKLWFFSKGIPMESTSDSVLIGKILHEEHYSRQNKSYLINGNIVIDFMKNKIIYEVKKSNKIEKAHVFQVLYYLYYLKNKGLNNLKGTICYPLLRKKISVELSKENETELINIMQDIKSIIKSNIPPVLKKLPYCRTCSYYELCYV